MGILRLFYPFGISSARDYQIEDEWKKNLDSMHMDEWKNGELNNGKIMLQW